jgi:hypothetical protein
MAKANYIEFESNLSTEQLASIFQTAVKKRPLKLKVMKSEFFKPTSSADPFEALAPGITPDFEVGATLEVPAGPDPARGTVLLSCKRTDACTYVSLRSAGNMRGRLATNSLMKHVLNKIEDADRTIKPERFSGLL